MHQDVVGSGCGCGHGFEPEHLRPSVASVDNRLHRLFFLIWNLRLWLSLRRALSLATDRPDQTDRSQGLSTEPGSLQQTESSGMPRSRTLRSSPYSAAWSATRPAISVSPFAVCVIVIPSNHAPHCAPSCPLILIW